MKLTLIKNEPELENEDDLLELQNELKFIQKIINKFNNGDEDYLITEDSGVISREDLDDYRFSNYNQALIKQQINKIYQKNRSKLRVIKDNHLTIV